MLTHIHRRSEKKQRKSTNSNSGTVRITHQPMKDHKFRGVNLPLAPLCQPPLLFNLPLIPPPASLPSIPLLCLPLIPLPSHPCCEVAPQIQLEGMGEHRDLSQQGSGWSPGRKSILDTFWAQKSCLVATISFFFVLSNKYKCWKCPHPGNYCTLWAYSIMSHNATAVPEN